MLTANATKMVGISGSKSLSKQITSKRLPSANFGPQAIPSGFSGALAPENP
jgi:hypothetical protein